MDHIVEPHVLIIEDSKSIVTELERRVSDDLGFTCECAETLAEARQLISASSERFFCAVADLHLPDTHDGEIVDILREAGIPTVVFTSGIDENLRKAILDKGVSDYIVKDGMAVTHLLDTLDRLWRNRGVNVLVCDDSRSFLEHTATVLRRRMFTVRTVSNGQDALDLLERESFTVAVMDYAMPGMDGLTLVRKVRSIKSMDDLSIIGVSSAENETLSVWFLKAGANDFLNKPFQIEELVSRVELNVIMLERLHKLRELDAVRTKFMGVVAHDLRNPINGIKGFAQLMLESGDELDKDKVEMLTIIRDAAAGMRGMVDDLLDISVIRSGRLQVRCQTTDLNTLVRKRISMSRFEARRKNIELDERLESLPDVPADADRIAQVVDNLLSNAIKFSTPGTTITVSLLREDGQAVVTVCDQGPGLPKEEQRLLFRDYHKGSAAPTGGETSTGFGLVIVNNVVKAHGGRVWVDSEPGQGACFGFALPME
ncbi:hybrid sensor histidine kinase/response regulator [Salidesulfovibrio brasiliensis]|uniref:hybrid sensor histidine kinase/response regulator n=1 Tax=Salidesulfovibrio brasiliensis TaxID=221711 RepID=UPI000A6DA586|nr:hybrid sensor histidine kinase/response regulator [Salidesulfovibrio brasiliensis]